MNLHYYYWYFPSVIPHKICDDIIEYGKSQQENIALTGNQGDVDPNDLNDEDLKTLHKKRKSNVVWMDDPYKLNQFYDWHCDSNELPYNKPNDKNVHGKIRKLSVTVSLSDESEYEGGDFEFDFRNDDRGSDQPRICKEIRPKGSVVVFPSFVWHRVKPVTSGTRYSLVIWNLGWPFR